jgi:hypothetical protein
MSLISLFKKPYISELIRTESEVHLFVGCKSKKCGDIFFTSQKIQIFYSCGIYFFKGLCSMENINIDYKKGNLEIIYIHTNKTLVSLKCDEDIFGEVLKFIENKSSSPPLF